MVVLIRRIKIHQIVLVPIDMVSSLRVWWGYKRVYWMVIQCIGWEVGLLSYVEKTCLCRRGIYGSC